MLIPILALSFWTWSLLGGIVGVALWGVGSELYRWHKGRAADGAEEKE